MAGFDFNPPFLYLITKLANSLLGEGLIVTRLPEIIGFWVFSLCVFYFVNRRAGLLAGFSVMLFPMFTGAFYYAYDARPHGLVLAFCGLALVAWQSSLEARRRNTCLFFFSLALFAAFMTHCYAILLVAPFGLAELLKSSLENRLEVRRWIALLVPALLAMAIYAPLLRAYDKTIGGTVFLDYSPLRWVQVGNFYLFLLAPCILIFLLILLLLALKGIIPKASISEAARTRSFQNLPVEIGLALSFIALPAFGLLLALGLHSPFFGRYFLSALAGLCLLVGYGVGLGRRATWVSGVLAAALAFSLVANLSLLLWHRAHGWAEHLIEPSSGFADNISMAGPLENYQMLMSAAKSGKRVIVLWPMDFMYLVNYAAEIRPQLYYVGWSDRDPLFRVLERMHEYVPFPYHTVTKREFYATPADFLVFGIISDITQLQPLTGAPPPKSLHFSNGRYLAEMSVSR
jgi:hypothetical protein